MADPHKRLDANIPATFMSMTPASIAMPVVNLLLPALRKSETTQPCGINRLVRRKSGRPTERSSPAPPDQSEPSRATKAVMRAARPISSPRGR